ncbi:MAG: hypothetical protein ACOCPM_06655 [Bacteroidales bacterium]
MAELNSNMESIKAEVKKLRILLIILTFIQIGYMVIVFTDTTLWMKLDFAYKTNWMFWGLHYMIAGIFIWFIWQKMPVENKKKAYNTFVILFLGIIGMWLWLPDNRELSRLSKNQHSPEDFPVHQFNHKHLR